MSAKTTTEQRECLHKLIGEAENNLKKNPVGYRRKLGLLAGLGYAYIFGILILAVSLVGLCVLSAVNSSVFLVFLVKSKLIVLLLMVLYILIKALWVKLDAPEGYKLSRRDYPLLYKEIDAIGQKLQAPKIHEIILTAECNAAITQTPQLGIFGWQKNTLIIGLVLLMSTNKSQFLSVIAHEFGHLSANHSRFSGWIYRVRMAWIRIMDAFDDAGGWAHLVFGRFFNWYAPYFNAYSFALARANEYEADAVATQITSKQAFVEALTQAYTVPDLVEKHYWLAIDKLVDESEQIKTDVFTGLHQKLKEKAFPIEEKKAIFDSVMAEKTGYTDTHPSFKDRVSPYTNDSSLLEQIGRSAAEEMFEECLPSILKDFDQDWVEHNHNNWVARHKYLQQSKSALQTLEKKQDLEKLDQDELWKLATLTEELMVEIDALPYYQAYHQKYPDDPDGQYALGRLLLARDNKEGVQHLNKAMLNHHATIPACELIYAYFQGRGDQDNADAYRVKAERYMDLQARAKEERANLYDKDVYIADKLNDDWMNYLREQFGKIEAVKAAWVCQKEVRIFPDERVYVVVYEKKGFSSRKKIEKIIVDELEMPSEYFVLEKKGEHRRFARRALEVSRKIL